MVPLAFDFNVFKEKGTETLVTRLSVQLGGKYLRRRSLFFCLIWLSPIIPGSDSTAQVLTLSRYTVLLGKSQSGIHQTAYEKYQECCIIQREHFVTTEEHPFVMYLMESSLTLLPFSLSSSQHPISNWILLPVLICTGSRSSSPWT